MINLLPPLEKKNLQKEEKYRLILILEILLLFFLVSLSLILFSVKIYISGQAESQRILAGLKEEEGFKTFEAQNLEREIKLINQNLSGLTSFYKSQPNFVELLEKISGTIPEGICLTTLSLSPSSKEENKFQISLSGFCPAREILFNFKKRLEEEPGFQELYFPPSNWVKSKDIDFTITFQYESK